MAMADLGAATASECECYTFQHSVAAFLFNLVQAISYIISRRTKRTTDVDIELGIPTSSTSPSNMAPLSQTFDTIVPSAAALASTTDRNPHRLSSYNMQDHEKGPSRIKRTVGKVKSVCKSAFSPVKKLFRKKEVDEMEVIEISAPTDFRHLETATQSRRDSSGTVLTETIRDQPRPKSYVLHQVPLDTQSSPETSAAPQIWRSVRIAHPVVQGVNHPATPSSGLSAVSTLPSPNMNTSWLDLDRPESIASSAPSTAAPVRFPVKEVYKNRLTTGPVGEDSKKARDTFIDKLDGHPAKDTIRSSKVPPMPNPIQLTNMPRPQSSPPKVSVNLSQFDPHISGFDDPRETYYPGKYSQSHPALSEVTNAANLEVDKNRTAALGALEGTSADAFEPTRSSSPPVKIPPKGKKPAYTSRNPAHDPRCSLFVSYNGAFDKFNPYGSTDFPRASSDVLPTDNDDSSPSRPSTPATSMSSPGILFTPHGAKRHSDFVTTMDRDILTGGIPLFPDDGPEPGSQEFLQMVYRNPPPPPPAAVPAPVRTRDTLQVPVPARKPVGSFSKPRPRAPTATGVDVNKSLPPSPAPNSPRCFTPLPQPAFPPRTDSLMNPVAGPSGPRLAPVVEQPHPYLMNDNGLPMLNRDEAKRWSATPAYQKRGHMNEMEKRDREYALNRQASLKKAEEKASQKAALKAEKARVKEAKATRRKLEKDEKVARKICGLM